MCPQCSISALIVLFSPWLIVKAPVNLDIDLQAGAVQGDADGVVGDAEVLGVLRLAVNLLAPLQQPHEQFGLGDVEAPDAARPAT